MDTTVQPSVTATPVRQNRGTRLMRIARDWRRNRMLYVMLLPVLLYYLIFHYGPMYGAVIAFQDFNPVRGIAESPWVGFKHFNDLFTSF